MVKVSLSANRMSFVNRSTPTGSSVVKAAFLQGGFTSVGQISSVSVTPTPNAMQFAAFGFNTSNPTSVTGNGITWNLLGDFLGISGQVGIWYAYSGGSSTPGGLTVSGYSGSFSTAMRFEVTGVTGTIRQQKQGAAITSTAASLGFDAVVVTGNVVLCMLVTGFANDVAHNFTAPLLPPSPASRGYQYSTAWPGYKTANAPGDITQAWTARTSGGSYIPLILELAA